MTLKLSAMGMEPEKIAEVIEASREQVEAWIREGKTAPPETNATVSNDK